MRIEKLTPYFSEKLWGGSKLKEMGFDIPKNENIGEAWVISAHVNGLSYFINGDFKGKDLKTVFENNRNLFGNYQGQYPLLSKIIAANDYLSVQVHPDDEYAMKRHNQLGKPESWYILDCPEDAELIYGHNAKNKTELRSMIENKQWDQLLRKQKINKGDFLFVDIGKIHAITPGVTVFELQRSSDITYRLYDYDRLESDGQARRLDIEDSINCVSTPDTKDIIIENFNSKTFSSKPFSLYVFDANKENRFSPTKECKWLQFTVIDGVGTINGVNFHIGESAIAFDQISGLDIKGSLKILISWI